MAVSTKISKTGVCLFLGVFGIAGAQTVACSSKFSSCYEHRNCPKEPHAEAGAAGDESGDPGGSAGGATAGASGSGPSGNAGSAGTAGHPGPEGNGAGMAGAPSEPDVCDGRVCDTPPDATCKDANTRTTYASSGTCNAGSCSYGASDTACTGDTPRCKELGASSQCVACLSDTDCSNGGTCNSANACVCSARFNGKHCEFQVFRGLGALQGDSSSSASNISHDGSVVIGTSVTNDGLAHHAFRSVNGGPLQFISASGCTAWSPSAVDHAGNVLLTCSDNSGLSLYSVAGSASPIAWPADGRVGADISLDGQVIVGGAGTQAVRRAASLNTVLGPLQPVGSSWFNATNGDGSIAVGRHNNSGYAALRWTSATGLVALPVLSIWINTAASDVSTDGKVIVGWASLESEVLSGQVAVKWSGPSLTPSALSGSSMVGSANAVNLDGSVIVGDQGSGAMLWDSAGAHALKSLLGATPDLTSDWSLDSAVGVSDDGKFVVGTGTHQTHGEAWVAHLP